MCAAVASGKNPKQTRPNAIGTPDKVWGTHSGPDGCPAEEIVKRKAAGLPVHCANHCGLSAALDAHKAYHPDHDGAGFDAFVKAVEAHMATLTASASQMVSVVSSGTYDPRNPDGSKDVSQPFSIFSMAVSVPHTEAEHDAPYQTMAPVKRAAEKVLAEKQSAVA